MLLSLCGLDDIPCAKFNRKSICFLYCIFVIFGTRLQDPHTAWKIKVVLEMTPYSLLPISIVQKTIIILFIALRTSKRHFLSLTLEPFSRCVPLITEVMQLVFRAVVFWMPNIQNNNTTYRNIWVWNLGAYCVRREPIIYFWKKNIKKDLWANAKSRWNMEN